MIHSRLARRIDTGNHELFADSANLDLTSRAAVYGELVEPRERARLEGETARIHGRNPIERTNRDTQTPVCERRPGYRTWARANLAAGAESGVGLLTSARRSEGIGGRIALSGRGLERRRIRSLRRL
jgi:hypothetical protein